MRVMIAALLTETPPSFEGPGAHGREYKSQMSNAIAIMNIARSMGIIDDTLESSGLER